MRVPAFHTHSGFYTIGLLQQSSPKHREDSEFRSRSESYEPFGLKGKSLAPSGYSVTDQTEKNEKKTTVH